MSETNGLDLLREEMESDDIQVRINCVYRLRVVFQTMSADNIWKQVYPVIEGLVKKEEDEVLFALAEELGDMGKIMHNHPQHLVKLLSILEELCSVEETLVRAKSVDSIVKISDIVGENEVVGSVVPIVLRLANNESNFTSRVSAVQLIPKVYTKAGKMKEALRNKFNDLSREDTPMVKRAVAAKMGQFAQVLEKQFVVHDLIQQFKDLASDDQDSVRVNSLESLDQIVKVLTKELNKTHVLPMLIQSTEDKSWKIRHALAQNFPRLIIAFGMEMAEMNLLGIFSSLLRDTENEVKLQALNSLSKFVDKLSHDKLLSLLPHLLSLHKDLQSEVRVALCTLSIQVINKLKKDTQLLKFLPQLLALADDDVYDVKVNNIQVISVYVANMGVDHLNQFLPIFNKAKTDNKWRLRQQTLQAVIHISVEIKNFEMFLTHLDPIICQAMKDSVFDIRQTAIQGINKILTVYQSQWLDKSLLNKISDLLNPQNKYLIRITGVQALESTVGVVPNDYFINKCVPLFLKASKDPVKNVRIAFAKVAKKVLKALGNANTATIKGALQEMNQDPDKDISFFSADSLL